MFNFLSFFKIIIIIWRQSSSPVQRLVTAIFPLIVFIMCGVHPYSSDFRLCASRDANVVLHGNAQGENNNHSWILNESS